MFFNFLIPEICESINIIYFIFTIGTVLAAYISFGANPAHLITSSVMSAPAALCFSKLVYPETEKIYATSDNIKKIDV